MCGQILNDRRVSVLQSKFSFPVGNLVIPTYHISKLFRFGKSFCSDFGVVLQRVLIVFLRLRILQFGSLGQVANKLCFPPGLFDGGLAEGRVGGGIPGGGMQLAEHHPLNLMFFFGGCAKLLSGCDPVLRTHSDFHCVGKNGVLCCLLHSSEPI